MISKQTFVSAMESISQDHVLDEELFDLYKKHKRDYTMCGNPIEDMLVEVLEEAMDDKCEWISYQQFATEPLALAMGM